MLILDRRIQRLNINYQRKIVLLKLQNMVQSHQAHIYLQAILRKTLIGPIFELIGRGGWQVLGGEEIHGVIERVSGFCGVLVDSHNALMEGVKVEAYGVDFLLVFAVSNRYGLSADVDIAVDHGQLVVRRSSENAVCLLLLLASLAVCV